MFKRLSDPLISLVLLLFFGVFLLGTSFLAGDILRVNASPANGDSGSTGGGDSSGNSGGDNNSGNGTDTSVSQGNATDGGSGGGSNQNDSGDEGNNSSGNQDNSGSIGGGGTGPKTLSGFVYNDLDRSGSFNSGDTGIASELIEVVRPASYTPAWTDPARQEVTSTDDNGNPTGWADYPAVYHPEVYTPESIYTSAQTDSTGFYVVNNLPYNGTFIVRHWREPLWQYWVRTSPREASVTMSTSQYVRFGMVQDPPPPGPFYQNSLVVSCASQNSPHLRVSWTDSAGASDYRVYYTTPAGGLNGGWSSGGRSYLDIFSDLQMGNQYGFIVYAAGKKLPEAISDNGVWSHIKFGSFTTFPDCAPPGAFNMNSGTPRATCPSAGNSQVELSWDPSALADYYIVTWANQRTGAQGQANVGGARTYNIPGLTTGDPYVFLVEANRNVNPYKTYANGNWVGSVTIPNCAPPTFTTFTISSGGRSTSPGNAPLTIKQAEAFDMGWNVTNTSSCTATMTAAPGSETLTPAVSGAWLVNPKPVSGTHSFGVNTIISKGTYDFTLTCTNPVNSAISASASVGLTVQQLRNPYIEFQGDFHTNESINLKTE